MVVARSEGSDVRLLCFGSENSVVGRSSLRMKGLSAMHPTRVGAEPIAFCVHGAGATLREATEVKNASRDKNDSRGAGALTSHLSVRAVKCPTTGSPHSNRATTVGCRPCPWPRAGGCGPGRGRLRASRAPRLPPRPPGDGGLAPRRSRPAPRQSRRRAPQFRPAP